MIACTTGLGWMVVWYGIASWRKAMGIIGISGSFWLSPLFWCGLYLFGVVAGIPTYLVPAVKARVCEMPVWVPKLYVMVTIVLPRVMLPLVPQLRLAWPVSLGWALGAPLVLFSVAVFFLAFRKIGMAPAVRRRGTLITDGVYALVRHPLYLGNVLFTLGWALCFRAVDALLFWPVVALSFVVFILLEERGLDAEYGRVYHNYARQVRWRMVPWVF